MPVLTMTIKHSKVPIALSTTISFYDRVRVLVSLLFLMDSPARLRKSAVFQDLYASLILSRPRVIRLKNLNFMSLHLCYLLLHSLSFVIVEFLLIILLALL